MDIQGDLVEKYKKKDDVPLLEKSIQEAVKRMKDFQMAKQAIMKQLEEREQAYATVGQQLMSMMPQEPGRELQGMNFGDEEDPEQEMGGMGQQGPMVPPGADPQLRY